MKKLKLNFEHSEQILTRDQLRRITGGLGSHPNCEGLGDRQVYCCDNGTTGTCNELADKKCTRIVGGATDC